MKKEIKTNKPEVKLTYNITRVGQTDHYLTYFDQYIPYSSYMSLYKSPSGNCQAGGISFFSTLLACFYNYNLGDAPTKGEVFKYKFAYICMYKIGKKLYVIDVRKEVLREPNFKTFKKEFCIKESRVKKNNYISTNGSYMCLTMIELDFNKLEKIVKDFENKYNIIWDIK